MYIQILIKYILGYVHVRLEGFFVERVMNKVRKEKLFMWSIKRDKTTIVYLNVGVRDFKRLVKIARENKCNIKIINRNGFPFLLNKYKKRKIFAITLIVLLITLIVLSNFIWNIDIQGTDKIKKDEIVSLLKENGLDIGKLKYKIKTNKIINEVRLKREDISWIGIELKGTNAIIRIVEAEKKPEIVNKEDYCNIVALKDAQIVKLSALNGIPVVKEGDIVTKGEILIAGYMEGKFTGTRYVHASGEVKAKVWYSEKEKMKLNQTISEKTGIEENKYKIKFNNFEINLYKTLSKFKKYDTIYTSKKIKIFSNFYLPIELIKVTNYEKIDKQITYGTEEATEILEKKLEKKIEEKIENKDNILQKYKNTYAGSDYIELELTYEVLENIETNEKIVF